MADSRSIPLMADLRALATRGLADSLGIDVLELTAERVVATMPVDQRTRQPFGILHGGASVALAETVASLGATANVDREEFAELCVLDDDGEPVAVPLPKQRDRDAVALAMVELFHDGALRSHRRLLLFVVEYTPRH
jgi:hypothetical protein